MHHLIEQLQATIAENGDLQLLSNKVVDGQSLAELFEWKDVAGNCLLHLCVASCRLDCLDEYLLLMDHMSVNMGKCVNEANHYGRTPLHLASFYGWDYAVHRLLNLHETEVDKRTNAGCTSLYFACCRGHFPVVQMLLESRADPNIQTNASSTSLIAATVNNHLPLVKALLEEGACSNVRNSEGKTALHIAAEMNNKEIMETLISHGANTSLKDHMGRTPNDILLAVQEKLVLSSSITLQATSAKPSRVRHNHARASCKWSSTSDSSSSTVDQSTVDSATNPRDATAVPTAANNHSGVLSIPTSNQVPESSLGRQRSGNPRDDRSNVPSRSSCGSSRIEIAASGGAPGISESLHYKDLAALQSQ